MRPTLKPTAKPSPRSNDRNIRAGARKPSSFTATEAKNEFGRLLERAIQGDAIVITKHDSPKAVLISFDKYKAMQGDAESELEQLTAEFDAMFERMQTKKARQAMYAGFHATPEQMGKAAVAAARKRD